MSERYSIEVTDESVEIYGELTIEETFDYLSFFERKGYKSVILGTENSTLHLLKRDQEQVIHDEFILTLKEQITDYKEYYENEKKDHESTSQKLKDVERLLKALMSEQYEKYKKLHEENQELIKSQTCQFLHENPKVQEMLDSGGFIGSDSPETEVKVKTFTMSALPLQEKHNGKDE